MLSKKLQTASKSAPPRPLTLVFDTSLGDTTIELPLKGTVNVTVDWGDSTSDVYTTTGTKTHTYSTGGIYTVTVSGTLTGFGGTVTRPELTKCLDFGTIGITDLSLAFYNCANLNEVPDSLPSGTLSISQMFAGATSFNHVNVTYWNTSTVDSMQFVFNGATSFNQNIGSWDVSNVNIMNGMFQNASSFNQNIGNWKVGGAFVGFGLESFFNGATNFNQDLTGWCVGSYVTEPGAFSTGSALTTGNKPVWGTCPGYTATGSITYIGQANGVTSATLPSHQTGDLILAFAFRDGSTTLPTQPTGLNWSQIDTTVGTTCSSRIAYKVATSSSETTGTWTNATTVIFLVYRGVYTFLNLPYSSELAGTATSVSYPTNAFWQNFSRLVAFAGHRSTNTTLGTAPGDLSLIVNPTDATDEAAAFESANVDNYGSWANTSVAVGGTASGWITYTLRLPVPRAPT